MAKKDQITRRIDELTRQRKRTSRWAVFWFITGFPTLIFGGFIMVYWGFKCKKKSERLKKEIFELELQL